MEMSNIKLEALVQECSKRKLFSKIMQNSLGTVCRSLFYNEGVGCMDKVKLLRSHFTRHGCFLMKFAKFLRTPFRTLTFYRIFVNRRSCQVLFLNCWFCNSIAIAIVWNCHFIIFSFCTRFISRRNFLKPAYHSFSRVRSINTCNWYKLDQDILIGSKK